MSNAQYAAPRRMLMDGSNSLSSERFVMPMEGPIAFAVSGMNCIRPRAAALDLEFGLYLLSCQMMA